MRAERYWFADIKKGKINGLSISWDYCEVNDIEFGYPVLLFTPHADNMEHYHIALSNEEAKKLHN